MAVIQRGQQQDFRKIPVLGLVPQSSSTAPTSPVEGQLWLDTSVSPNRLKTYENGSWVLISQTGAELLANKGATNGYAALVSGTVPITQLPTGSTSTTVCIGNDSRLSDQRVPTDGSVTGGTAGTGVKIAANTITAANIANGTITDTQIAAANKDGAAGTYSLRTLGTGAAQALAGNTRLDQITAPTSSVNFNSQELTNLGAPTTSTSAARLADVQAAAAGIDNKPSVRAVATANVASLSGTTTIDGVSLIANDRVLLVAQSTQSQNGPWLVQSGAWTRPPNETVTSGSFWMVTEGTSNAGSQWKVGTADPITLGTTALTINQFGVTNTYTGTTNRITVTGLAIDISASYVGQSSITTVGTITSGTWTGTTIAVANGGTGATSAANARTNLGAPGKYTAVLGAITAGVEFNIVHNLNTTTPLPPGFKIAADGSFIELGSRVIDANTIGATSAENWSASALVVTVIG